MDIPASSPCLPLPQSCPKLAMTAKYRSPAKKARSCKRLIQFLMTKLTKKRMNLMITSQASTSFKVVPKLQTLNLPPISISPKPTIKPDSSSVCLQTDLKPPDIQVSPITINDDFGTAAYHKREAERQESVRKTLEMVDQALSLYH